MVKGCQMSSEKTVRTKPVIFHIWTHFNCKLTRPFADGTKPLLSPMYTYHELDIFRFTCSLSGESTGHWWILLTKANDDLLFSLIRAWNKRLGNRDISDLRLHRAQYDVTVMCYHRQPFCIGLITTRWSLNKITYIFQANAFSGEKIWVFWLKFCWKVQSTIRQHWLR